VTELSRSRSLSVITGGVRTIVALSLGCESLVEAFNAGHVDLWNGQLHFSMIRILTSSGIVFLNLLMLSLGISRVEAPI
jgi:hypothetical protein